MKRPNLTLLIVALTVFAAPIMVGCTGDGPGSVSSPMVPAAALTLAWSDEFDGTSLDMTKWSYETGYGDNGWGNDEWQEYTSDSDNIRVENGELIITARSNGAFGKRDGSITSARITTENKLNIRYGKISARIKVPASEATWPAFWALGANFNSVGWPRCGEIDIMEVLNRFSDGFTTHSTVHWWNEAKNPPNAVPPLLWDFEGESRSFAQPLSDDYHVFEAERTAANIIFRIDGITVFVRPLDATMSELADEFFLLLNVAIGGTHGADPTAANFSTPQEMRVDWVRVHAEPGEWRDPPDPSLTRRGIFSETHINPMLPYDGVINTIDWSANAANYDMESTGVAPKDGVYSMSIDYVDLGRGYGGVVFQFDGADFTKFASLATYNALVFSLNTSAFPDFDDIEIVIEDPRGQNGQAKVQLTSYTPEVDGDWKTYTIPLTDFPTADLTDVSYLMFLTPVNAAGNTVSGLFYLDDIHLAAYSTTERGIFSEQYTNPALPYVRAYSTSEWSSSPTTVDPQSTEVTPFEGSHVLTVDFDPTTGPGWGGVVFEFADVDFSAFTSIATYNALVFSLNTAGFAAFDDLTVEIQDGAGGTQVSLSSLEAPDVNGDWSTYSIPLGDFAGSDITQVKNLLFVNPVDGNDDAVPGKFHLDDIHLATVAFGPPAPSGIYSETYTNPMVQSTIATNAIFGWGGSGSNLTVDSTAVAPVEGTFVLTYDHFADGDGWGGVIFEFPGNTDLTGGGQYNTLVFSLNTSTYPNFVNLNIEMQTAGGNPIRFTTDYNPAMNGDWATYRIPLADFSGGDPTQAIRLMFFNPQTPEFAANNAYEPGVFHLDNVYLAYAPPPTAIYSETISPVIPSTIATNAIFGWGGSGSTLTVDSTQVAPVEGSVVLTYNHFADGDGWGGVIFEFAGNADLTDGGKYDTLVFSLNTSTYPDFVNLNIEMQTAGGNPIKFTTDYTPDVNGDWATYQVPLADFSGGDPTQVIRLMFFNPQTPEFAANNLYEPGVFHLDQIYLR